MSREPHNLQSTGNFASDHTAFTFCLLYNTHQSHSSTDDILLQSDIWLSYSLCVCLCAESDWYVGFVGHNMYTKSKMWINFMISFKWYLFSNIAFILYTSSTWKKKICITKKDGCIECIHATNEFRKRELRWFFELLLCIETRRKLDEIEIENALPAHSHIRWNGIHWFHMVELQRVWNVNVM